MRLSLSQLANFASLVALVMSPATAGAQQKEELSHPKTLEELQKAMKEVLDKEHVPGAGIALVALGQLLWCGGIGKADIATNRDVTCDTEFRVGSISKTPVALALLKLEEDGKINLEARLQDVAPEVPLNNRWEATNPVRIVNLLEHTAGFDDMEPAEVYNLHDPYNFALLEVFKRFREPQAVRWPPGTRMSYANPGYGIAGYLIEKITGRPFDRYIRENFLRPMGMEVADYHFTDLNEPLLAAGYNGNPPRAVGYPLIYLRPAGDLKASPGELAKLVQFFLRRGKAGDTQLLKTESVMRMEAVETTLAAKNGLRLGYSLANYTKVEGGVVTHGHDGGIDGFISSYRYMPEQNWGYVVLLNSTQSSQALVNLNRLAIDFLSKDFQKPQQLVISLLPSELEKFTGYYAPRAPRTQLFSFIDDLTAGVRIRIADGHLIRSEMFGTTEPLFPVGKNLFRGEKDPEATTVFFTDDTGKMALSSAGPDGRSYSVRVNIVWPHVRLALLVLCVVLMASSLLFALLWLVVKLFGGTKEVRHLDVRAVPLLASLTSAGFVFCVTRVGGTQFGTLNIWTAGIFVASLLFPMLSLYGFCLVVRVPKDEIHRAVRIHSYLVSGACCILTIFFASWHLIGVRLWAAP